MNLHSLRRKIGLNTLYQVISRFITATTGLLVTRLVISSLGATTFGEFQIAVSYVTLFWLLTDFGLNAVVVRQMAAHPEEEEKYFGSLVSLRTLISFLLITISSIALVFLPYSSTIKMAILIGLLTILTQGIKGSIHGLFQVHLRYDYQLFSNLIGSLVYLGAVQQVLRHTGGVIGLTVAFTLGQVASTIITLGFAQRLSRFHFNRDFTLLRQILKVTLPFGISLLFNLANFKLDTFLLSIINLPHHSNAQAVGIYNVGYKFFEFGLVFPTFLMNAVYPVMVKRFEESIPKFKILFWQVAKVLLTTAILAASSTYFLAPYIINLVANLSEFADSVTVLRLLMLQAPIFFLSSLLMWTTLVFENQQALIKVYASAFLVNLTLNLIFIPRFEYFAASLTTGISELVILILLAIQLYPRWK